MGVTQTQDEPGGRPAEEANDGEAVEVLIALADLEKAGDGARDPD